MNLPDGIKHAVVMGANEAFNEWLFSAQDDPAGALETLGSSYQEVTTPDMFSEDDARRFVADLAAWDDGSVDASHDARVRRFEILMCNAGIDFARGLIAQAATVGAVPDRVKPYVSELAPLVAELKKAIAEGSFDDAAFDLNAAVWG